MTDHLVPLGAALGALLVTAGIGLWLFGFAYMRTTPGFVPWIRLDR